MLYLYPIPPSTQKAFMAQSLLIDFWPGHYTFFSNLHDGSRHFANSSLLSEVGLRSAMGVSAWFFVLDERIERARDSCGIALPTIFNDYRKTIYDKVYATRITLEGTRVLRALVRLGANRKEHGGGKNSYTFICPFAQFYHHLSCKSKIAQMILGRFWMRLAAHQVHRICYCHLRALIFSRPQVCQSHFSLRS